MELGYIKTAAGSCAVRVADCEFNRTKIADTILHYTKNKVDVIFFPELCVTGATCGDLFLQEVLLKSSLNAIDFIAKATKHVDTLSFVGFPFMFESKLYSCMACINKGTVLGIIPSNNCKLANFSSWQQNNTKVSINTRQFLFGNKILFKDAITAANITCIIGDVQDLTELPVSCAMANSDIIGFCTASYETASSLIYRRPAAASLSSLLNCGIAYALAGEGESTTDNVYSGYCSISQSGDILSETPLFSKAFAVADIDTDIIKCNKLNKKQNICLDNFDIIDFELTKKAYIPYKVIAKNPFLPKNESDYAAFFERTYAICAHALAKRISHANCRTAVIGISGGLDSTLALLTTVKAFSLLNMPLEQIVAVTLPCFGTSEQTKSNARLLCEALNVTLKEIDISNTVTSHFSDINQPSDKHDVTFENAQARMRTLVLMDIANQCNGIVVGTGDLSELALGWATYNGDHMSMYSVNAGIPKTIVKLLCAHAAKTGSTQLSEAIYSILKTPISPELLPPSANEISQKTEDIVGPYELHDFFIYYAIKYRFSPKKIFVLAVTAFTGEYDKAVIFKWLYSFYRRFFAQQYKRSCMPDGPQVFDISFSPRGGLLMPSDAICKEWLAELDEIKGQ